MKKFLPLVVFLVVFSAVLAGQIGLKIVNENKNDKSENVEKNENKKYENLFLSLKLKSLEDKTVELFKLQTPLVVVNFWASWCRPCLEEMPSMIKLKNNLKTDVLSIIAINTDEEDQINNIKKIKAKIKLKDEFIVVPDKEGALTNEFNISAIPVTVIFLQGKVVHVQNGPMDFNSIELKEKINNWIK